MLVKLLLKLHPQFCSVHIFCACLKSKPLRNIFKMVGVFPLQDRIRKEHETAAFRTVENYENERRCQYAGKIVK